MADAFHVVPGNRVLELAGSIERSCDGVVVQSGLLEVELDHGIDYGRLGRLRVFQEFAHVLGQGGIRCVLDAPPTRILPLLLLVRECFFENVPFVACPTALRIR